MPRAGLIAAPIALLATGTAVSLGVQSAEVTPPEATASDASSSTGIVAREPVVSRNGRRGALPADVPARSSDRQRSARLKEASRPRPVDVIMRRQSIARAVSAATDTRWTTTELNIWTRPDQQGQRLGVLDTAVKVRVTGREFGGRQEIVLDGGARWVTAGYLDTEKPQPEAGLGGTCTNGTSIPAGVSPNIRAIHEAVCSNFPEISTYGTLRSDGEHAQGIAMDIMVAGDRGWEVADFIRQYSAALGVNYVIHARNIWSVQRSAEGWRPMADRGSVTANHYDHVHVTTY